MNSYRNQAQKDLQTRIQSKRDEATRLENQRGLGAREAVEAVQKANQLRSDADWLETHSGSHEVRSWLNERESSLALKDDQNQRQAQQAFSAMQNELLGAEDTRQELIRDTLSGIVYNGAVGVDKRTLERQIGRLLNGEGETDSAGNRYVRFQQAGGGVHRAVVTSDGHYGFVLEGRGDSGMGDSATTGFGRGLQDTGYGSEGGDGE